MTISEALKAALEFDDGIFIPKPPNLAGSASNFLLTSLGGGRPVRVGINSKLSISSITLR